MKHTLNKPAVFTALTGAVLAAAVTVGAWAQMPANSPDSPPPDLFDAMDANHDGTVSKAEFDAFRPAGRADDGHPHGPGDHHGDHWGGPHMGRPDLNRLDTDKDGKISLTEFSAPMKDHFDQMDTNHDGSLSGDELKAPDMPPPPRP